MIKKGAALFQVWLMIFGIVGFTFMISEVSAGGPSALQIPKGGLAGVAKEKVAEVGVKAVAKGTTNPDSWLSNFFGTTTTSGPSAIFASLQYAAIAYFAGTMLGNMLGLTEDNSESVGWSLAAGIGAWKGLSTWSATSGAQGLLSPGFIGLGVGIAVFVLTYKDVEVEVVTFDCMPWQAPSGGNNCKLCNDDDLPCSEYRCRSLGATCEIVNMGTEDEQCVNVNPRDVNPPVISPNEELLSVGYRYTNVKTSPPSPGFKIMKDGTTDGCLEAFTPLQFGISIKDENGEDEPAQCKIDFNHTMSFDEMIYYVGGNNLYLYEHSEELNLPSVSDLMGAGFVLENGKDMTFFIRCRDGNGNENSAEYAVNFCVDPTPDSTAPVIRATSIANGGCVAENTETANVDFYTNEPAQCRWSTVDQIYDNMENEMICENSLYEINAEKLFTCTADFGGIPRDGTNYYIKCKDKAVDENVMGESFVFNLRGSTGLILKNLQPNETIMGGVSPMPVELYAETLFGCNNGQAVCRWSSDGRNYIEFFDTNAIDGVHTQRLDLSEGSYEYFVQCVDEGGNLAEDSVKFNIEIDRNPPSIARVYEEGGMLKIVTVRPSECAYTFDNCDFSFGEGTEMPTGNTTFHIAEWNEDKTYYIKCRDEYLNEEADCSIVIRPTENFL